jgi:hypothetical protein
LATVALVVYEEMNQPDIQIGQLTHEIRRHVRLKPRFEQEVLNLVMVFGSVCLGIVSLKNDGLRGQSLDNCLSPTE